MWTTHHLGTVTISNRQTSLPSPPTHPLPHSYRTHTHNWSHGKSEQDNCYMKDSHTHEFRVRFVRVHNSNLFRNLNLWADFKWHIVPLCVLLAAMSIFVLFLGWAHYRLFPLMLFLGFYLHVSLARAHFPSPLLPSPPLFISPEATGSIWSASYIVSLRYGVRAYVTVIVTISSCLSSLTKILRFSCCFWCSFFPSSRLEEFFYWDAFYTSFYTILPWHNCCFYCCTSLAAHENVFFLCCHVRCFRSSQSRAFFICTGYTGLIVYTPTYLWVLSPSFI